MPELPEVETTVRQLRQKVVGKKIKRVEILSAKQFPDSPQKIIGQKIVKVERRGKLIIIALKQAQLTIHLKLTGQLVFAPRLTKGKAVYSQPIPFAGGHTLPGRSTRVVVYFTDGSALFFNDLRKFGWMRLGRWEDKLGIEPLSPQFTLKKLKQALARTRRAIKVVLLDQERIAGIGNIYANEILFAAKIHPFQPANELTEKQIKALRQSIIKILRAGVKHRGTSAADDAYIKPDGKPGQYQSKLKVYQRDRQPCPRCQTEIVREKLGGRGTFFCPQCQRATKQLTI